MIRSQNHIQRTILKHFRRASGSSTTSIVDFTSAGTWSHGGFGEFDSGKLQLDMPIIPVTPSTITDLGISISGSKLRLDWTVPDDRGSEILSYKIYRGYSSGTETFYETMAPDDTYYDDDIIIGTTYFYKISALNAAGESDLSNEVSGALGTDDIMDEGHLIDFNTNVIHEATIVQSVGIDEITISECTTSDVTHATIVQGVKIDEITISDQNDNTIIKSTVSSKMSLESATIEDFYSID